jgi:heme/copper-type cytochrome/quinol oxidase subunit 1
MRSRHRADQRQPEAGAPGRAAVTAAEPVEHVPQQLGGDALPGVRDDHPDRLAGMLGVGILSFFVWQHHLFVSGINPDMRPLFMLTTELISIPTGFIFLVGMGTFWKAKIRFSIPMLFALAFYFNFLIGGIVGFYPVFLVIQLAVLLWLEILLARSRYIPALSFVEQPPTYAKTYVVQRFQASLSAFSTVWSFMALMAILFWLLFYAV